jgi:hypothetical protein
MSENVLVHKWYLLEVSAVGEDLGMRKEESREGSCSEERLPRHLETSLVHI